MWHRFVRWVGRRSLGWFFRDVVIADADRIPTDGPVIIIANHPNDLPDVLIGYLSTPRDVHFIATISAATNPLARATYRGLGVIPVTRVRDARKLLEKGASLTNVNRVAYQRVVQALHDGHLIGVFPEGGVNTDWALRTLKPGVAQMVLQCFENASFDRLLIVPLGLQYEEPDRPWSDCIARVGEPIVIDSSDVAAGSWTVQKLTAVLFQRLADVTRHGPSATERATVDQVAAVLGASLSNDVQDGLLAGGVIAPELSAPDGTQHAVMTDPAMAADVQRLCDDVLKIGGRPRSAADHALLRQIAGTRSGEPAKPSVHARSPNSTRKWTHPASVLRNGNAYLLALTAPFAAAAWVVHAPLFAVIWRLAVRTAESRAHRVGRVHLPGLYIVFGWYLFTAILAAVLLSWSGVSILYSLLLFMLLFRSGDFAVQWRHGFAMLRLRQRANRFSDAQLRDIHERYVRVRSAWTRANASSAVRATHGVTA